MLLFYVQHNTKISRQTLNDSGIHNNKQFLFKVKINFFRLKHDVFTGIRTWIFVPNCNDNDNSLMITIQLYLQETYFSSEEINNITTIGESSGSELIASTIHFKIH